MEVQGGVEFFFFFFFFLGGGVGGVWGCCWGFLGVWGLGVGCGCRAGGPGRASGGSRGGGGRAGGPRRCCRLSFFYSFAGESLGGFGVFGRECLALGVSEWT